MKLSTPVVPSCHMYKLPYRSRIRKSLISIFFPPPHSSFLHRHVAHARVTEIIDIINNGAQCQALRPCPFSARNKTMITCVSPNRSGVSFMHNLHSTNLNWYRTLTRVLSLFQQAKSKTIFILRRGEASTKTYLGLLCPMPHTIF